MNHTTKDLCTTLFETMDKGKCSVDKTNLIPANTL